MVRGRISRPDALERLAAIDPNAPITFVMHAALAVIEGNFEAALSYAERAHEQAESIFGFYHVHVLVHLRRFDEARSTIGSSTRCETNRVSRT